MKKKYFGLILFLMICSLGIKAQNIVITEIMYNDPSGGTTGDSLEFLEVYNPGLVSVDLTGYQFTAGITYSFAAGSSIAAQGYLIVAKSSTIIQNYFGITGVLQWDAGQSLANNGEALVLKNGSAVTVDSVRYYNTAPWPTYPNGLGSSLMLCDPFLDNNVGSNWSGSSSINASLYASVNNVAVYATPLAGCNFLPPYTPVFATIPYLESFDNDWLIANNLRDVPNNHWLNTPNVGNNSWRRESDGAGGSWTAITTGAYTPVAANATTHSARFHSSTATTASVGNLDLYVNLSPAGDKKMKFWYMNSSGTDSLSVYLSNDNGATFNYLTKFITNSGTAWEQKQVIIQNATSATSVIRFRGTAITGTTDIGIDEVEIAVLVQDDAGVFSITAPTTAMANLTEDVKVVVRNYGANTMNNVSVHWAVDGNAQTDVVISDPVLSQQNSAEITLGAYTFPSTGVSHIKAWTSLPNGNTDPDAGNDSAFKTVYFQTYATIPLFENFDSVWINKLSTHDVPSNFWANEPATGSNSWRRADDGATAAWTNPTVGAYTPAGANATVQSARFHTSGSAGGQIGALSLYIDMSTPGDKELRFYHNNTAGNDSLAISISTDGGNTFTFLQKYTAATTWTAHTIFLGNISSPQTVIRFRVTSNTGGNTDVGLDQVIVNLVQPDVGVSKLIAPVSGCNIAANSDMIVRVKNFANLSVSNIDVHSSAGTFTVAGPLEPGDSVDVNVGTVTILVGTIQNLSFYTSLSGDINALNDTLHAAVKHSTQISTFPYLEDFETGSTGTFDLIGSTNAQTSIETGIGYTGSVGLRMTGNAAGTWPANSGTTTTATQAFSYADHKGIVSSSCQIDGTTLNAPELKVRFRQTYSTGLAYNYFRVVANDTVVLADNNGKTFFNAATQDADTFDLHTFDLQPYANSLFKISFQSACKYNNATGQNGFGDNVILDNILIKDKMPLDAGVTAIISPSSDCNLSSGENVKISVKNFGADTLYNIPVYYKINNGIPSSAIINTVLIAGESMDFIFPVNANLGAPGTYTLSAGTILPGDGDATNDIKEKIIVNTPYVSAFPYLDNFEAANSGWSGLAISGINDWEHGTPAQAIINTAHSGASVWMTGLAADYSDNSSSALVSPCFNMSSLVNPILSVWLNFHSEANFDAMVLESSNNGGTWTKVTGTPFYNNNSNQGTIPGPKWSGNNNGWTFYTTTITSLAGSSKVQFRFRFASDNGQTDEGFAVDDFSISEAYPDLIISQLVSPLSACGMTATETVTVNVRNNGFAAANGFSVGMKMDAGANITEVSTDTILPGAVVPYTFTATANATPFGIHHFTVRAISAADMNHANDSATVKLYNTNDITNPPGTVDFETSASFQLVGLKNAAQSKADAMAGIGANGSAGLLLTGGAASTWPNNSGNTTTVNQAFGYADHIASVYTCDIYTTSAALWALSFDMMQTYADGPRNSWARVMLNDNIYLHEMGTGDSTYNPVTASSDVYENHMILLPFAAPYKISLQAACKYDAAHSASGIADATYLDNIGIIIIEGIDKGAELSMLVYPNPAKELLNFSFGRVLDNAVIEVRNLQGQLLNSQSFAGKKEFMLDLKALPAGVYSLSVKSNEASRTLKFVHTR